MRHHWTVSPYTRIGYSLLGHHYLMNLTIFIDSVNSLSSIFRILLYRDQSSTLRRLFMLYLICWRLHKCTEIKIKNEQNTNLFWRSYLFQQICHLWITTNTANISFSFSLIWRKTRLLCINVNLKWEFGSVAVQSHSHTHTNTRRISRVSTQQRICLISFLYECAKSSGAVIETNLDNLDQHVAPWISPLRSNSIFPFSV